jgi:predicted nucleotidyltransferase
MRGQAKPDSDLDIMVVAPEGFVQLMAPKWSEELQEELRVRIDIRGHTDVGPDVIERVKNEGRRIFSRGTFDLFTAFEDDIDVVDPFED